jgi:hypothetical protein
VVVVVSDLERGSWLCEVQALGAGFHVANDFGCVGFDVEAGGVLRGQLEAVEQGRGPTDIEIAGGESVNDSRESDLDGLTVFECRQLDVLAGQEVATCSAGVAKLLVALVEAGVEVTPLLPGEGWSLALKSVGLDVTAERVLHDRLFGGGPPGLSLKSPMVAGA